MFERFTDRARRVLIMSRAECLRRQDDAICPEHLLLALTQGEDTVAMLALEALGLSVDDLRQRVEERADASGPRRATRSPQYSAATKKAFEFSLREALELEHNYIGTEHLLLGVIRGGDPIAAQTLLDLGADGPTVRRQVVRLAKERRAVISAGPARVPHLPVVEPGGLDPGPSGTPPDCPQCRFSLVFGARSHRLVTADADGAHRELAVVYCGACGCTLSIRPVD